MSEINDGMAEWAVIGVFPCRTKGIHLDSIDGNGTIRYAWSIKSNARRLEGSRMGPWWISIWWKLGERFLGQINVRYRKNCLWHTTLNGKLPEKSTGSYSCDKLFCWFFKNNERIAFPSARGISKRNNVSACELKTNNCKRLKLNPSVPKNL